MHAWNSRRDANYHLRAFPTEWRWQTPQLARPDLPGCGVPGLERHASLPLWEDYHMELFVFLLIALCVLGLLVVR
jgi:hypothetical protein